MQSSPRVGQRQKRRGELADEVVGAEVIAVRAELLGRDRTADALQQWVRPRLDD